MAIPKIAQEAYSQALQQMRAQQQEQQGAGPAKAPSQEQSFASTVKESLAKVNELQSEKSQMIEEFASGKSQNVQELMVSLQKAGVAMEMTTAVRSKVLEAYKELMNMPM
jgi:flagellar hook-basal body complex protein FliE